jgi:hypothetical protein
VDEARERQGPHQSVACEAPVGQSVARRAPPRRQRDESSGLHEAQRSKSKSSVPRMARKAKLESSWPHMAREN